MLWIELCYDRRRLWRASWPQDTISILLYGVEITVISLTPVKVYSVAISIMTNSLKNSSLCRWFQACLFCSVALMLSGCDNQLLSRLDSLEAQAEANARVGQAFLADNRRQAGVISTRSGLQYRVLQTGSGKLAQLSDRVRVHYRGRLIGGSQFDSSYDRGESARFPVAGLIAGWQEALQLMRAGDRWQLFVPSGLAYGKRSPTPKIPSSSTLLFELELLAIEGDQ